ncbi:FABP family protein [Georgenia sp. MJ170]|uniref:FABP family protein n=1 Tax=Georgenia sunbinii TaxID=3117728 RepID=UPI002F266869
MSATFAIPEGLAPEIYPLAWLVGPWRGYGVLAYPGITEQPVIHEVTFDHDGGPYLRCTSTMWTVDAERSSSVPNETSGAAGAALLHPGGVWASETSYWRVPPGQDAAATDGAAGTGEDTGASGDASAGRPPRFDIEVLVAQPSGHVSVYVGQVRGPRIDLVSDAVVRTASAAEVTAGSRMYGLVGGELMWVESLAAFGHELQSYSSGRLSRQDQP